MSLIISDNQLEVLKILSKEDRAEVLVAVTGYMIGEEIPVLTGSKLIMFQYLIDTQKKSAHKPTSYAAEKQRRYRERKKAREAVTNAVTTEVTNTGNALPEAKDNKERKEPKERNNINNNYITCSEVKEENIYPPLSSYEESTPLKIPLSSEGGAVKPRKVFRKPTFDEVSGYCAERNNHVDPQAFLDFYDSKGWVIGKSPMKDWKAAVRTWEQRRNDSTGSYGQRRDAWKENHPHFQTDTSADTSDWDIPMADLSPYEPGGSKYKPEWEELPQDNSEAVR